MTLEQFISIFQTQIQNIDGNLEDCILTLLTPEHKLLFIHFEDGMYMKHKMK